MNEREVEQALMLVREAGYSSNPLPRGIAIPFSSAHACRVFRLYSIGQVKRWVANSTNYVAATLSCHPF